MQSHPFALPFGPPQRIGLSATSSQGSGTMFGSQSSASAAGSSSTWASTIDFMYRLFRYRQMDFDFAWTQMVDLCVAPRKVYQLAAYRHQTKGRWARDDPAFAATLSFLMAAASVAYGFAFSSYRGGFSAVLLSGLLPVLAFLGLSLVVSWLGKHMVGRHLHRLRRYPPYGPIDDYDGRGVEWGYAYDVHCNAAFVTFMVSVVLQFFLLPVTIGTGVVACVVANTFHGVSAMLYFYMTWLGYSILPNVKGAEILLSPGIISFMAAMLLGILNINLTRICLGVFMTCLPGVGVSAVTVESGPGLKAAISLLETGGGSTAAIALKAMSGI